MALDKQLKIVYEAFCIARLREEKQETFPDYSWMSILYENSRLRTSVFNKLEEKDRKRLEHLLKDCNDVTKKIRSGSFKLRIHDIKEIRKEHCSSKVEIRIKDNIKGKSKIFIPTVNIAQKIIEEWDNAGYVSNDNYDIELPKQAVIYEWEYSPGHPDLLHGEHDSPSSINVSLYDPLLKLTKEGLSLFLDFYNHEDELEHRKKVIKEINKLKNCFKNRFILPIFSSAFYDIKNILMENVFNESKKAYEEEDKERVSKSILKIKNEY